MNAIMRFDETKHNAFQKIVARFLILDLWILMKLRRVFKACLKLLLPAVEILCVLGVGACILFAYTLMQIKVDVPAYSEGYNHGKIKPLRENLLSLTDASRIDASRMKKEFILLKNQAQSLEIMLRKMKSKFRSLQIHNEVKEDLADFASEAAGASILDTPDTQSFYEPAQSQITLFGIPLWSASYFTPRKIIQPWTQPGECWAFHGSKGKVEIALAYPAIIGRVTLEHIPASVSLTGKIDSAPKAFNLLGKSQDGYILIDKFVYNIRGSPSQTFQVNNKDVHKVPFNKVMLEILSNWGHPEYTCIYRFRVHGRIFQKSDRMGQAYKYLKTY
ncbi:SUN domain-containing protein 2 isoform X1 [Cephus cinctus]|uniref:SUN domain-containing protein 2 isoform X1 n=1 Tax=Cephus cinctus TaxID=211228 RepID=A0AAJ7FGL3_CEPCN|nr:SUN domain-containing protein 2 isoform X1 [Cephus cinctus]